MCSYRTRGGAALALALAFVHPKAARAQTPADSARARACVAALRIAARGLEGEAPAGDDIPPARRIDRAWSRLQSCGPAAGVVAGGAWRQLRTVSDTAQLHAMYARVWSLRDASVFSAASTVAADPAATPQSRVYSLMLITAQLFDNWNPGYRRFVAATTPYRVCLFDNVHDRAINTGAPLPTDARVVARTLARSLAANGNAPADVQSAGRCLDQAISAAERVEASPPASPPGS
jgi:hypothetical protein